MKMQLQSVQALRGLAALSVMAYHYREEIDAQFSGLGSAMFNWGLTGVDLFFVLSGFVITLSVSRMNSGVASAADFLKRRAARLLPAYFILLAVNFLLGGAMATFHYPDKVLNLISALTLTVAYTQHGPFYVDDGGLYGVRWTLNYEFLFYLLMAVSLLTRWRWAALAVLLTTLLIVVPVASGQNLTLNTAGYDFPHGYLNLMSNPIIWEFTAGVVTGLLWPHTRKLPVAARIPMLVAGILLAVIQIVLNRHVGHGLTESGTVLALLLAAVAFNDDWLARITPGWLVFIGDISFSLYLLHMVTMRVVKKNLPVEGVMLFITAMIASVFLAWLSRRYVEPLGQKLFMRGATSRSPSDSKEMSRRTEARNI